MNLLDKIDNPKDLKKTALKKLPDVCFQIRRLILDTVSRTGGHLASSLGAVELAVSLHYCLDTPHDFLLWDVGHQAYAHKILTGRRKDFSNLRQAGGISGFPSKDESIYDCFTAGHASSSLSLALGLACAQEYSSNGKKRKIVAVIGDGSLTGGMCFEALNNMGHLQKDLLVIFNTNEMSIAPSVGALSNYLNKIISLPVYNRFREALDDFISRRVPKGKRILGLAKKFEEGFKNILVPGIFFEELGFRYIGPLDGHNIELLVTTLRRLLIFKGPILLHVITKKGRGYKPAEDNPENFHSVGPFDLAAGVSFKSRDTLTCTRVFSRKMLELAKQDNKIVAITAAMSKGTGLDRFAMDYPDRFFDVGIAEGHAVGLAAGFAKAGLKPVVAIYSTFLQRSFDQIMFEVCLQNLGVIFAIDRAGIVGEDGVTHQGIFDIAYLRAIPGMTIMAPYNFKEMEDMIEFALNFNGPVAIRYPKGSFAASSYTGDALRLGKAEVLKKGKDIAIVALGSMVSAANGAAGILAKEDIDAEVINARFASPIDESMFDSLSKRFTKIITVEEGILNGGFGSAVSDVVDGKISVRKMGLPLEFIRHDKRDNILASYGLDSEGIAKQARKLLSDKLKIDV